VDDDITPADAREYGHTHLDEIVENADAFQNEAILMIHFSARYKAAVVRGNLANKLPEHLLKRVTPMLVGFM